MNRRDFLRTLGLVAPAAVVAPTYFFAPKGGWLKTGSVWMPDVTAGLPAYSTVMDRLIISPGAYACIVDGKYLDRLVGLYGISRAYGESDESLRKRVALEFEVRSILTERDNGGMAVAAA